VFQAIRWADNDGQPYCPKCGCTVVYGYKNRPLWKCKACRHQFSVTSGTIFAHHKLPLRDYLLAIAIFCNSAIGHSALQLSRDLDVQYKTAFVLAHKLREAMKSETAGATAAGEVEIDGAWFGGYVKPTNWKENRRDRRLAENRNGKRQAVIVVRERKGRTLTFVEKTEDAALPKIREIIAPGTVIHADEAAHWDKLRDVYLTRRINHTEVYSDGEACTNQAEAFFQRLRKLEATHFHIGAAYLSAYAAEAGWREDHRRVSNGNQYKLVVDAAMQHPVSRQWAGYWQRVA
jgi:transposase-like protein